MNSIDLIECPQCGGLMQELRDEMGLTEWCYSCGYFHDISYKHDDSYEYILDKDGNLQHEEIEMMGLGAFGMVFEDGESSTLSIVGPDYLRLPEYIDRLDVSEVDKAELMKEHGEYIKNKDKNTTSNTLTNYEGEKADNKIEELIRNAFIPVRYVEYIKNLFTKTIKSGFIPGGKDDKLDVSKCYLTVWNCKNKEVEVIYGQLPDVYRKYTKGEFFPYSLR